MGRNQVTLTSLLEKKFGIELEGFKGCEIGVWAAATSVGLLKHFPTLHLYMIDPWLPKHILGSMKTHKSRRTTNSHYKHSCEVTKFASDRRTVLRKTSEEAVVDFEDESLDFIFIDGNHTYEGAKQDLNLWWPKVKVGGLIVGHDYNGKMEHTKKVWGVKKAVDEFVEQKGLEAVEHRRLMFSIDKGGVNG